MEKVSTFIRIVMSLLVTLLLFSTVVPSPYAATRGPYASIEVSKTADVSGSTIFGSITITCTSKIAARITSIVDWLEVHYPKERRWKKVADVPLAVGLPVTLDPGATMTLVYSYGVTDTYEGANSMRNVVSVQLANSNHKGTNAPYVTRSESFKPPAPSPSKDLIVYWHEGGKTVYVNGTQVTNGSTIPFQRNEVANITAVPDAHYDYYTVRINATDDVTLNSWDPDRNYDKCPYLYPNNVWWQSDGEHRTVLEFDLSSIPKFKRHNATFSMYLEDNGEHSEQVYVDRLTASFIADEATWNNRT
ncbi:MAG: DNRLRE domain-containing protein, partial [Candidatus Bathyarchaeia archaeon]